MKGLSYVEAKGTNYDIGFEIGRALKPKITKHYQKTMQEIIFKGKNFNQYVSETEPFFRPVKKTFPFLIDELKGLADGSGVPFDFFFRVNCKEGTSDINLGGCTTAISRGSQGILIGHNEDWVPDAIDYIYVLKAEVNGVKFLGLNYSSTLCGNSATLNSFGLVQTINELRSTDDQIGVPKNFVSRAILEAGDIDEVIEIFKKTKRAFSYNHNLVHKNRIVNIETTSKLFQITEIKEDYFVHANHYLTPLSKFGKPPIKSSLMRQKRASELVRPNMEIDEMKVLLSDVENYPNSISNNRTIASIIVLPQKNKILIAKGQPHKTYYQDYLLI